MPIELAPEKIEKISGVVLASERNGAAWEPEDLYWRWLEPFENLPSFQNSKAMAYF